MIMAAIMTLIAWWIHMAYVGRCLRYRFDNEREEGSGINAIGSCTRPACSTAVDIPRKDGETDASYYQRMDNLHWA